jgi:heme exporter protein C
VLTAQDKRGFALGLVALGLVLATWLAAFFYAPTDANQGEIYRIMFLHVPSAVTAFSASALLAVFCVLALRKRSESVLTWGRAAAEVGFVFTLLTLITGSVWGRPTWGVWWTWDARLTTTLLLAILYAAFLLLYANMQPGPERVRGCAVLGILIAVDVPIIYKSVNWWRTLHQPQSLIREGGSTMAPEIVTVLLAAMAAMLVAALWLVRQRGLNLKLKDELERATFEQLKA